MQATVAPARPSSAPAIPSSRKPATKPITAARIVIRPRADPWVPVVPASMPTARPIPSSVRRSMCENLTEGGAGASIRHTSGMAEVPEPTHRRRSHAGTRDLERYAGLFAERTGSDALLGDARPDGDHRAAGSDLPRRRPARHLDLPAAELRRADDPDRPGVGGEGAAVRADRGLRGDQGLHPRGDGRRGDAPRPRRHHRHHRRPAGDRPGLQDPARPRRRRHLRGADLPRRDPGFCSYQADVVQVECDEDGMQVEALEELLARSARRGAAAEVHLLGAELPEPGRGDDVAAAAPPPGRAGAGRRTAGGRGQPLRAAALRRRADAAALPARRRRLRHLPRHLLEDPLPRDPPRLGGGAAAGDGEDRPRQAGRRPLHLDPDPVLRPRVLRRTALAALRRRPGRDLPRPPRHDAGGAAPSTSRPRRPGPSPRAASSSGRRCPTTSTPATCWRRRCAPTSPSSPARPPTSTAAAATRCGSTSPASTRTKSARGCGGSARRSPSRSSSTGR